MKKFILTALASSVLFASYLDEYEHKNYKKAFELAQAQCEIDCNDERLNMIMARSAERLKKTSEAIAAYDRALIINEDNIDARFSIANLYYENGNPDLMRDELNYMLENLKLSSAQKDKINKLLSDLDSEQALALPYYLALEFGFGYDSNPLYGNDKFSDFKNPDNKNYTSKKQSGSASINYNIIGSYNYDFSSDISTQFFASFMNKKYLKNKEDNYPDLNVFSLGVNPSYKHGTHKISLNLGYDFIMLRRAAFLHSLNLGATYENHISDSYLFSVFYEYSKGIFYDSKDKDSNFNHHSFGVNNVFAYEGNIFYAALNFDLENAKNNPSSNSDFYSYGFKIGAVMPFMDDFAFKPSISFKQTNYKDTDMAYYSKRKDRNFNLNAGIDYSLASNQTISLNLSYDNTNSNHNIHDSVNYTGLLMYRYEF